MVVVIVYLTNSPSLTDTLSATTLYVGSVVVSSVPVGIETFPVNGSASGFDVGSIGFATIGSPVLESTGEETPELTAVSYTHLTLPTKRIV